MNRRRARSGVAVAVILAVAMGTAINLFVIGVVLDSLLTYSNDGSTPGGDAFSENAIQVLTGWGGGIIGVIGALVGYKVGERQEEVRQDESDSSVPSTSGA